MYYGGNGNIHTGTADPGCRGSDNGAEKRLTGSRIVIGPKPSKTSALLLLIVLLAEATASEK